MMRAVLSAKRKEIGRVVVKRIDAEEKLGVSPGGVVARGPTHRKQSKLQ